MSAKIKIVTVIYVFILAGIVFLADFRGTRYLLDFVGDIPFGDKTGHFLLMGMLSFFVNLGLNAKTFQFKQIKYLAGSLMVFALVALEEFSQIFVHGRTFDSIDLIFDGAGIFVFGEVARFICRSANNV